MSKKPKPKIALEARRHEVAEQLSLGLSITRTAEKCGMTFAAVKALTEDPEFKSLVEFLVQSRIEAGRRALTALVSQAAMTLQNVMQTDNSAVPKNALPALLGKKTLAADSVLDRVGLVRSSKVEQSGRVLQVTAEANRYADFEGRSPEALLFYGSNGHWPEEAPEAPKDDPP